MLKIFFILILAAVWMLFPGTVMAIAPPRTIAETNLEAEFIAIGEVVSLNLTDTNPHFTLKVTHVIKGYGAISDNEQLKILTQEKKAGVEGVAAHVQGVLPVKVQVGQLVLVYLERADLLKGFFKPKLAGSSVVVIGKPLTD